MTKDNVNVSLDAVLYWHIIDPYQAQFGVTDVRKCLIERYTLTSARFIPLKFPKLNFFPHPEHELLCVTFLVPASYKVCFTNLWQKTIIRGRKIYTVASLSNMDSFPFSQTVLKTEKL
jgi:hypothetical protein